MGRASTGMRLRHPDGQVFTFDAGALCLEFVYTGGEGARARFEIFHEPADIARWSVESRLDPAGHGVDPADISVSADDFRTLWRLREALWTLALGTVTGRPADPDAVAIINELAAGAGPVPRLERGRAVWLRPVTGAQFAAEIARDAVRTFADPDVARVRKCGAPDCYLIYVDTSRPGRRRWCSMQRCGNRHKVAEFRHRHDAREGA
ncbi:MAG TPA: ABATE domain-containing protein [Pilimelia sp.]|nr:ABATE domain-containing protein [Pilimelia sp.]